jgi:arylsulfatase
MGALNDDEKRLFIRQATDYAAFLACTDHEIGRVVQAASAESSPNGAPSGVLRLNEVALPVAGQIRSCNA